MKLFKFVFLAIVANFSVAQAGPLVSGGGIGGGSLNPYITCDNEEFKFEIRGTAVPTFKQGLLLTTKDEFVATLECKYLNSDLFPGQPSAGQLLWSCTEYPTHDGNFLVSVQTGGYTGLTAAYVSEKQIFPLEPKAIATLNCHK